MLHGNPLVGNGAGVIRLAGRVQRALERLYRIDPTDDVAHFIELTKDRETLLLREDADGLRVELRLPQTTGLDGICQVIEGVDSIGADGLCERLFENVRYVSTEERYRVANASAHRFVRGLERKLERIELLRDELRRFFWSTQEEKLRLAAA
jgi:hypothetical protein